MKIGFIGLGNMGAAVLQSVAKLGEHELLLSNHNLKKAEALQGQYGGTITSNQAIVKEAEVVFLGVKPHLLNSLLDGLAQDIQHSSVQLWISMAAGVTLSQLSKHLRLEQLVRMMPNTPVAIGKGMTTFSTVSSKNAVLFSELMAASGEVKELPEHLLDVATAIAGCGPAFVYEWIEAMTKSGVQHGLSVADARFLASQTLVGAAQMVLDTGKHPAQLRDEVTSPGGSTIAGLAAMTRTGFQAATMAGIDRALERTQELGK